MLRGSVKKKVAVAFLFVLSMGFIISNSVAGQLSVDDVFVKLIRSESDLTRDVAEFRIRIPNAANITTQINSANQITFDFLTTKGSSITRIETFILVNVTRDVIVYERVFVNRTCQEFNNVTKKNDSYDCSGSKVIESYVKRQFEEFMPADLNDFTFIAGREYTIRLYGYHKATLGKHSVDWVPTFKIANVDLKKGDWAWWNSSWMYKKPINVTNNDGVNPILAGHTVNVSFNHTDLVLQGKANANGTDMRVIENDERDLNSVLPIGYNWDDDNTTLYLNLTSDLGAGATNSTGFHIYYGNPGAGPRPENDSKVFIIGETFDDDSFHYDWSIVTEGNCVIQIWNNELNGTLDMDNCRIGTNISKIIGSKISEYKTEMVLDLEYVVQTHRITFAAMQSRFGGWEGGAPWQHTGFAQKFGESGFSLFLFITGVGSMEGTLLPNPNNTESNITTIYSNLTDKLIINSSVVQEDFANTSTDIFYILVNPKSLPNAVAGNYTIDTVRLMHYHDPEPTTLLGEEMVEDTCTFGGDDWIVDCPDNCLITVNTNLEGNDFIITGSGIFVIDGANITNWTTKRYEGDNSSSICTVRSINGGGFK